MDEIRSTPSRVWLLSIPRSGSHLLEKIFSGQEALEYSGYNFNNYIFTHHRLLEQDVPVHELSAGDRNALREAAKEGFHATRDAVQRIEAKGKTPFIKEHISSILDAFFTSQQIPAGDDYVPWKTMLSDGALNPTLLPDAFFLTFVPIILVRHPALAYPSLFRASKVMQPHVTLDSKNILINMTMKWLKMAYLWLEQAAVTSKGRHPVIVDADDVIGSPDVLARLVSVLGGDPARLVLSWKSTGDKDVDPYAKVFQSTLLASEGILAGKSSKGLSLEKEMDAWMEEFGADDAAKMKRFVDDAMVDYEFFKARSMKAVDR